MSSKPDKSLLEEMGKRLPSENEETSNEEEAKGVLLGVGIAVLLGGVVGLFLNPSEPISSFFGGMFLMAIVGVFIIGALVSDTSDFNNQQQQQTGGNSKPKVVCSSCGWKNPKSNNYCHDCGEELET